MHRLRTSHSWNFSLRKPRDKGKHLQKANPLHGRDSPDIRGGSIASSEYRSSGPDVWSDAIEDQRDGFYRYSESLIEEEKRQASLKLTQQQESPDQSTMSSIHRRPYSVSSDQWVVTTTSTPTTTPATTPKSSPTDSIYPTPRALPLDGLPDSEITMHFRTVIHIFSQVYFVSKLMQIICMGYGIMVDETPGTGLMYWIELAESRVRTASLVELIETTENLYYVTYSRILIELSAVDLSGCFESDARVSPVGRHSFQMPEAGHLYRILVACKDVLDSPALCTDRDDDIVVRYQEAYVRSLIVKDSRHGVFQANDRFGFRRYAYSVAGNRGCLYHRKWDSVISIFAHIPPETLTLLAECYFNSIPSAWPARDIPTEELPFINLAMLDVHTWGREMTAHHRTGALAQLEGKTIGDLRREEQPSRLMQLVMHSQCICKSICHCAAHCTQHVEEGCPCAERQLRMQLALSRRRSGRFDFKTRIDSVVMCGFEGLAVLRRRVRDSTLMDEIYDIFKMVRMEISKERSPNGTANWPDQT